MRISGCYREQLTKKWWDSLTQTERFNQLSSLYLSDEVRIKWSKMNWDKLGGRKGMIKGLLSGIELSSFANKIMGVFRPAIARRLDLCSTSVHYNILANEKKF